MTWKKKFVSTAKLILSPSGRQEARASVLANLASALDQRFNVLNQLQDKEAAFVLYREAMSALPPFTS